MALPAAAASADPCATIDTNTNVTDVSRTDGNSFKLIELNETKTGPSGKPVKVSDKNRYQAIPANFYPGAGIVAVGGSIASFPKHDDVASALKTRVDYAGIEEVHIPGFRDGKNWSIRIDALGDATEITPELIKGYRTALAMAQGLADRDGGSVAIECSGRNIELAKVLGCFHLRSAIHSDADFICKRISSFPFGDVIYDRATGTRFISPDVISNLAKRAEPSQLEGKSQDQITAIRNELLDSVKALIGLLTGKNAQGRPEGMLMIVDPETLHFNKNDEVHRRFREKLDCVRESIENSKDWKANADRVLKELSTIAEEIKEISHPDFHQINLESPQFLRLTRRAIRGDGELDTGNTTQRVALPTGHFKVEGGAKIFHITTSDADSQRLINWALNTDNQGLFSAYSFKPTDADYLVIYSLGSSIHHEHHPAAFSRKFGNLQPQGARVLEYGRIGKEPILIVIEPDVWAAQNWGARARQVSEGQDNQSQGNQSQGNQSQGNQSQGNQSQGRNANNLAAMRVEHTDDQLTAFVRQYKAHQYYLIRALLAAIGNEDLSVAGNYRYFVLPKSANSAEISGADDSATDTTPDQMRMRSWEHGQLAHTIQLDQLSPEEIQQVLKHLADLMVVGIISQLPHMPLHDINIARVKIPDSPSIMTMTLLSVGESFCGSVDAQPLNYIGSVVPKICGNLIARFLGHYSLQTPQGQEDNHLERLISECLNRMALTFGQLSDTGSEAYSAVIRAFDKLTEETNSLDSSPHDDFKITRHLQFSAGILEIDDEQLQILINKVKNAALRELALIRAIAPTQNPNPTVEQVAERTKAVNAICACIWRHTQEKQVEDLTRDSILRRLEGIAPETSSWSIAQRTWLVTIIDFELRIKELNLQCRGQIKSIFSDSNDSEDFITKIKSQLTRLDLSDSDLETLYEAMTSLKRALVDDDTPPSFKTELSGLLADETYKMISST